MGADGLDGGEGGDGDEDLDCLEFLLQPPDRPMFLIGMLSNPVLVRFEFFGKSMLFYAAFLLLRS